MIGSFGDKATEDIFNGGNSKEARSIPRSIWNTASRKLDLVNAAISVEDLRVPPGNRLEALKGDLKGSSSIRVNDQYRIVFTWPESRPEQVRIMDYH